MSFAEAVEGKSKSGDIKTSSDYVALTENHQTIVRSLDNEPKTSYQHFIPKGHSHFPNANKGKGIGITCPGSFKCPVCKWNETQPIKEKQLKLRKLFLFNVIDRTPVKTCPNCKVETYGKRNKYPETCSGCGGNLASVEPKPINRVKIMSKGVKIARQIAKIQQELGNDLSIRDITIETRGIGADISHVCIPDQEQSINFNEVLGEGWTKHDLVAITKPLPTDKITRILEGESYFDVVGAPNDK